MSSIFGQQYTKSQIVERFLFYSTNWLVPVCCYGILPAACWFAYEFFQRLREGEYQDFTSTLEADLDEE